MIRSLLVIGAGVAGAAVAYHAAQRGLEVTVVDAGASAASRVPSALLNPVRGQSGAVDPDALAGLRHTWALVRDLQAAGHAIPHSQTGVLRPVPDARTRTRFERNLPADLPHEWLAPDQAPVPLSGHWEAALWVPEGGWLDGAAFAGALLRASRAEVVGGRATGWTPQSVTLIGGQTLNADAVVWCGGSVGATWADWAGQTHRAGTLLTLDQTPTSQPVSFGAYLAPARQGGVLGATFEAPSPVWNAGHLPLSSLRWLLDKGEAITSLRGLQVTGRWSGSRLSGLRTGRAPEGPWQLTGLGSKGFLLGPLKAAQLVHELIGA